MARFLELPVHIGSIGPYTREHVYCCERYQTGCRPFGTYGVAAATATLTNTASVALVRRDTPVVWLRYRANTAAVIARTVRDIVSPLPKPAIVIPSPCQDRRYTVSIREPRPRR